MSDPTARPAPESSPEHGTPPRAVTLADVAARAGVSKAAASKALNNRDDVSAATRTRVLAAASELGYTKPTAHRPAPLQTIALVLADLHSVYALDIINGATTAAMGTGTSVAVSRRQREDEGTDLAPLSPTWFTQMRSRGCIGCVVATVELSASQVAAARHAGIPLVVIDPIGHVHEGTASIGATNWNGGVQATEHLVNLGHERIAIINGIASSVPAQERLRGILSAMRAHGLTPDKRLVHTGLYVYETGFAGGTRWFSLPPELRPTAVIAGSDACAMGVYEAARRAGLRVPEDVSVVGFDDSEIASWASPRLTTVRQPLARMGAEAVRMVVEHRAGRPLVTSNPLQIETTLIERDSTAPPALR